MVRGRSGWGQVLDAWWGRRAEQASWKLASGALNGEVCAVRSTHRWLFVSLDELRVVFTDSD